MSVFGKLKIIQGRCFTLPAKKLQPAARSMSKKILINFPFSSSRQSQTLSAHPKRNRNPLDGKEFVKIVTRDGVRNLLVPKKHVNAYDEFWPEKELERLQNKAKVLTVEDKMRELQDRVEDHKKMREESEMRKQRLKEIDMAKICKMDEQKEDPYHIAEAEHNVKLLDRAFLAKQEQVNFI